MMILNEKIIPFEGTISVRLYQSINLVKQLLSKESVCFREEVWKSESETIPNPWNVLVIDDVLSLFFASNGKLFKMVFWEGYTGVLPNGICTGMSIKDAQRIDSTLIFDDWNEDFESSNGYWLEDDPDTEKIISISIYIKELLDEESFDYCKW